MDWKCLPGWSSFSSFLFFPPCSCSTSLVTTQTGASKREICCIYITTDNISELERHIEYSPSTPSFAATSHMNSTPTMDEHSRASATQILKSCATEVTMVSPSLSKTPQTNQQQYKHGGLLMTSQSHMYASIHYSTASHILWGTTASVSAQQYTPGSAAGFGAEEHSPGYFISTCSNTTPQATQITYSCSAEMSPETSPVPKTSTKNS